MMCSSAFGPSDPSDVPSGFRKAGGGAVRGLHGDRPMCLVEDLVWDEVRRTLAVDGECSSSCGRIPISNY